MNNDLQNALDSATNKAAEATRETIIPVAIETVMTGDAIEYGGLSTRTRTQIQTNHQLTPADRLGLYKEKAWHGLGEVIADDLSAKAAVEQFIGWRVVQEDLTVTHEGKTTTAPIRANFRSDNHDLLGYVSKDYQIVQNIDLGEFADAIFAESVQAGVKVRMETCGSLLGGRKVFLTMRPDRDIRVGKNGDDVSVPLLTLVNGHDGSLAMSAAWTFVRVVCNNTYTSAVGAIDTEVGAGRGFKIRHIGDVKEYLKSAKMLLGVAVKGLEKFQEVASAMAGKRLIGTARAEFFDRVYAAQYGPFTRSPKTDEEKRALEKADGVILDWMGLMDEETQTIDGIKDSVWAAFNATTQWQDHVRAVRGIKGDSQQVIDKRMHLRLLGDAATAKRKALAVAVKALSL